MPKYSKQCIKKLEKQMQKIEALVESFEEYNFALYQKYRDLGLFFMIKALVNNLLIELIYFKIKLTGLIKAKNSFSRKVLLKSISLFFHSDYVDRRRWVFNDKSFLTKNTERVIKIITESPHYIKELYNFIKKYVFIIDKTTELFLTFVFTQIKRRHIYVARFLVMTVLNFVPFIQLSSALFYHSPSRYITHPLSSHLFSLAPFLVPVIKSTMMTVNGGNFSFLILVPYMHIFAFSSRKYKISRKIAYQGSFALTLMLIKYATDVCSQTVPYIVRFTKRFLFLTRFEEYELLRDDLDFYFDDLVKDKSELLQVGINLSSNLINVARIVEPSIVISFLAVIALLYNYMYFIVRGKKPIIPFLTKLVQRTMVDRNSQES